MTLKKLGELQKGRIARIQKVESDSEATLKIKLQLLDMGLIEGEEICIEHEAPFGGDPIAVSVRGALVALRRQEANLITVEDSY